MENESFNKYFFRYFKDVIIVIYISKGEKNLKDHHRFPKLNFHPAYFLSTSFRNTLCFQTTFDEDLRYLLRKNSHTGCDNRIDTPSTT